MKRRMCLFIAGAVLTLIVSAPMARAQAAPASSTWSDDDTLRIVKDAQKKLRGLTNYGVFDWITFGIHGKSLVLNGYASRPILKSDAEGALKRIPGVESVENRIEVLPNSPNDDRIRGAVYKNIYTFAALQKYSGSRGMGRGGPSVARMAGGITNDPPMGYHGINIIVKNGNVILYGVVINSSDSAMAEMKANGTPGVFSVENGLVTEGSGAGK